MGMAPAPVLHEPKKAFPSLLALKRDRALIFTTSNPTRGGGKRERIKLAPCGEGNPRNQLTLKTDRDGSDNNEWCKNSSSESAPASQHQMHSTS